MKALALDGQEVVTVEGLAGEGELHVDGGVIDNLPVSIAARGMDAVIAVDTGSTDLEPEDDIATAGFASIYMRAATTMRSTPSSRK